MFKYTKLKRSQINKLLDCFILGLPALQTAKYTGKVSIEIQLTDFLKE
jgi:hypothetical protein